ncbi:hypothetical protein VAB18032_07580 [Micromonospora maris AB-18-032]|uniref:Uncharacterized protein n=1 Tax=Micromonospora maris TaxID=1003110 RepID=A0A9X0LF65_9ACTN|nr:hypothetical protein VAB18032_07580 [Micromonospora maris AB-18-032]KUJ48077.1 hypothetical protein ADL17_03060 [Micromonospora maris]
MPAIRRPKGQPVAPNPYPGSRSRRPSDRTPVPDDVTDRLLWALAVDVAAAHQPGPDGLCTNLQCRGQHGPCWALRTAHRAHRHARRTPATFGESRSPAVGAVRGRAPVPAPSVPAPSGRFTGWFTPTHPPAPLTRLTPIADAVPPESRGHRRPPVAAMAA